MRPAQHSQHSAWHTAGIQQMPAANIVTIVSTIAAISRLCFNSRSANLDSEDFAFKAVFRH